MIRYRERTNHEGKRTMKLGRRILTGAAAVLAGVGGLALGPLARPAMAANPVRILNSGAQNGTQAQWLESQSLEEGNNKTVVATFLVEHAAGRRITGARIDSNWNGTDDTPSATVTSVTPQFYGSGTTNFLETSRVTVTFNVNTPSISNGSGRGDYPIRLRVQDDQGNQSQTVSATVHVVDNTNDGTCVLGVCAPDGNQDYPRMKAVSGQVGTTTTPGTNLTYSFTCDDVDTDVLSSDDDCDRARIRWRRLNDGVTGGDFEMTGIDDNSSRSFTMSFPTRGYYVVEAQLGNENGNYPDTGGATQGWWRIGSALVNSATLPTATLSFSGAGVFDSSPPSVNAGGAANAVASVSDTDGAVQVLEWDATNDGTFERREYRVPKGPGSSSGAVDDLTYAPLSGSQLVQAVNTATPGTRTVAVRAVDNGGLDAADALRRTGATHTAQIRVNAIPVAHDVTMNISEDAPAVTVNLVSSDADNQPLTAAQRVYTITSAPPASAGTLNCATIPVCTFTPAPNFNGTTSLTYTVADGPATSGVNAGQAWATSAPATVTINVTPVNDAPIVDAQTVTTPEDTPLTFAVSASDIDGGQTLTFSADTQPANGTVTCSGTDGTAPYTGSCTFTPAADFNGQTSFVVRATDNGTPSLSGTATITIDVTPVNDAPQAVDQSFTIDEDAGPQSFTLAGSDVDLDPLTFAVVAPPPTGGTVNCAGAACTFTPEADFNGTSVITFTVTDTGVPPLSATGTVTFHVAPVNDPPQALAQTVTTDEDLPVDVTLTADDIDTPAAGLHFSAPTGANGPDHGSLVEVAEPVFTYSPDPDYFGGDQFDFTVSDGEYESTATVLVTVNPVNDPPETPSPQAFATDEDTATIISLSASDIDGDALTFEVVDGPQNGQLVGDLPDVGYVPDPDFHGADSFTFVVRDGNGGEAHGVATIAVAPVNDRPVASSVVVTTAEDTPVTLHLEGSDVDGDTLTFTVLTPSPSALGDLTCDTAGSCTYVPAANANGADNFVFEVNDGEDFDTADVTIVITPVNDPPTVAPITSVSTDEDTPLAISLHATDDDGDDLTFVTGEPVVGTLSGVAPALVYAPAPDFNGSDSFAYTVSDGTATVSASVVITVVPVNDPPSVVPVSVETAEDTPVVLVLAASDVDDDPSDLVIDPGAPAVGTLDCAPVGAELHCTYTPPTDFVGTVQWTYGAVDDDGASASALVTVGVASENDPPVAEGPTSVVTAEDTPVAVTLAASDVDGDELTYSILTEPANGALDGSGATLVYTPAADYSGPDSFEFLVEDGRGGSDTLTVAITVTPVNDAPVALPAVVSGDEDTPSTFQLQATDVEGDPLTFAVVAGPAHGAVACDPAGACTYTPDPNYAGLDSFTFSVSDPDGAASTATVSISVAAAPLVPTRLTAEPVLLTLGPVFRATLRTDAGAPVAGRVVVFRAGGQVRCQAVTNANGLAQCGAPLLDLLALLNLGYDASFAGDYDHAPSTARGPLVRVAGLSLF